MIDYHLFFKGRLLPAWWIKFTRANPIIGNCIAVAGLVWICFLLTPIVSSAGKNGHGELMETIRVTGTKQVVEKAFSIRRAYHQWFSEDIRNFVSNLYSNLALYLLVPFLLLLEFLFPCKVYQPLIGKGFLQDAIWYVTIAPLRVLVLAPVSLLLHGLFNKYLSFLSLHEATVWPVYVQVIAAVLLTEFLIWLNHFIRHKVRVLWYFHAVHHSQKEMNVFTDDRGHVIDQLVGSLLSFLPFFIFDVSDIYAVTVIGLFMPIHNRFIHSNIRMNLGWMGWIFTSPQFHRVHHSAEHEHLDKNFGGHLSIFDYLFGTACKNRNVYPDTGIEDPQFPIEQNLRIRHLPVNWIKQTVYPFLQVFEQILASKRLQHLRTRYFSHSNKKIKAPQPSVGRESGYTKILNSSDVNIKSAEKIE